MATPSDITPHNSVEAAAKRCETHTFVTTDKCGCDGPPDAAHRDKCVCGEINFRNCPVHGSIPLLSEELIEERREEQRRENEDEELAKAWREGRLTVSTHPYWQLPLRTALHRSVKSLDKIGEGDWTPQDEAHLNLVNAVTRFLASDPQLRTGRIVHGDA